MVNSQESMVAGSPVWVYMLGCSGGSYYIGITADLQRRLYQHASGTGARMTQLKLPVVLLATALVHSREEALRLEGMLKSLPLIHKEDLLKNRHMLGTDEVAPILQRQPTCLHVSFGTWRDGETGTAYRCLNLGVNPNSALMTRTDAASGYKIGDEPLPMHPPSASDYLIIVHARLVSAGQPSIGRAAAIGQYRLRTRAHHDSYTQQIAFPGQHSSDEAEYLTLCAALDDLLMRITTKHRDPAAFTVTVQSGNQLVIRQLTGEYRVKAANLQILHQQVMIRLTRFKHAYRQWKRTPEIIAQLRI